MALKNYVIKRTKVLNEGSCRVMCYMEPNCVSINLEDLKREGNICANQTMFQMKVSSAASSLRIAVLYLSGHRGKTCIVPFFMSSGLY